MGLSMVNDCAMYILSTGILFFALEGFSVLQDITLPEEAYMCIITITELIPMHAKMQTASLPVPAHVGS